jgi:hypothetical protein
LLTKSADFSQNATSLQKGIRIRIWMIFEVNQNLLNGVGGQSLRDIKRDEELTEEVGLVRPEEGIN